MMPPIPLPIGVLLTLTWVMMTAGIILLGGYISPDAAKKALANIVGKIMVISIGIGSIGFVILALLVYDVIYLADIIRWGQNAKVLVDCAILLVSEVGMTITKGYLLYLSSPLFGNFVFFVVGVVWGCLWKFSGKSGVKSVGAVHISTAGLDSLAQIEERVSEMISKKFDEVRVPVFQKQLEGVREELSKLISTLNENVVNAVSRTELADVIREIYERIPSSADIEESPVIIALKKATGDLQKGAERISGKLARLGDDVAKVNMMVDEKFRYEVEEEEDRKENIVDKTIVDESSESDTSEDSGEWVQVLKAQPKKTHKKKSSFKEVRLPSGVKESMKDVETVSELREKLKAAEDELKKEKKAKQQLTEEEKTLTREGLERKWAEERRNSRQTEREDRPLSLEEKSMTRTQLRRHLAEEASKEWAGRMRERGIEVVACESCGRMLGPREVQSHRCMRAPWGNSFQTRRGVPQRQEMVISATPGGVRLGRQTVVDQDMLEKNLAAMAAMKEKLDKLSARMQVDEVAKPAAQVSYAQVVSGQPVAEFQGFHGAYGPSYYQ